MNQFCQVFWKLIHKGKNENENVNWANKKLKSVYLKCKESDSTFVEIYQILSDHYNSIVKGVFEYV